MDVAHHTYKPAPSANIVLVSDVSLGLIFLKAEREMKRFKECVFIFPLIHEAVLLSAGVSRVPLLGV